MGTEVINEQTAVQAAEQINEIAEDLVQYVEVIRNNPAVLVGVGVVGVAIGAAGGYFIAKKRLEKVFAKKSNEEIAEAREFYSRRVHKIGDGGATLTPQEVLASEHGEEALAALQSYRGVDEEDEALLAKTQARVIVTEETAAGVGISEEVVERNVFLDPTFDLEVELQGRSTERPYVISHDEFFESEKDYENQVLTYFEADDTVVDEGDKALDDPDRLIGEGTLNRFGHGSRDKNVVYVRNDRLEMDFEIVRGSGSYLEALGLGPEPGELKHSDQRLLRRAFLQGEE